MMSNVAAACFVSILIIAFLTNALQYTLGIVLIQALTLLFLFGFVYAQAWQIGEKDINYANTGHIVYDPLSGLKIGLIGMAVFLVPFILMLVGIALQNQLFIAAFRLIDAVFYGFYTALLPVKVESYTVLHVLLSMLPPLVVPAASALGYFMGHRRISLLSRLVYKKKKPAK